MLGSEKIHNADQKVHYSDLTSNALIKPEELSTGK